MTEPNGKRMWRQSPLKSSYEVAIVGAGVHGLATAYYLAKNHGITDVAVLDKGYLGGGASGRNTAIVRSNYRTAEGVPFYQESVKLYEQLAGDLDYNVMFSQHGHLTLAHTDRGMNSLRERAEMNQILGVNSRVIFPDEIQRLVPAMALKTNPHYPVMAALYHPPGGIIRHDAVVWGYARGCDRAGCRSIRSRRSPASTPAAAPCSRCRPTAARSRPNGSSTAPPVTPRPSRGWSGSTCRSRRTRCRRASPNR